MIQRTCNGNVSGRRGEARFQSMAALIVCMAALAGCSEAPPNRPPVFPVKGSITVKGQPPAGALVALHPRSPAEGTPNPRANVAKDGSFSVSTYATADGAPEGDYVLTVLWYKPVIKGVDVVAGPNVIPANYANPNTSDLNVSVKPVENALPAIAL